MSRALYLPLILVIFPFREVLSLTIKYNDYFFRVNAKTKKVKKILDKRCQIWYI